MTTHSTTIKNHDTNRNMMQRALIQTAITIAVVTLSLAGSANAQMQVGTNLDGIADWGSTKFVDMLKHQRMWTTRNADGSGSWGSGQEEFIPSGPNGWPAVVPFDPGNGEPMQIVHTVFPVRGPGIYRLIVEGTGSIDFIAGDGMLDPTTPWGRNVAFTLTGGMQMFDLEIHDSAHGDGIGVVFLEYNSSDAADPVRNMKLIAPGHENTYQTDPFFPTYVDKLAMFTNLRFMDWGSTNSNPLVDWSDRATPETYTQAVHGGAAIEHIVELANQQNQDAWFCIPAEANDLLVQNTAIYIRDNLDPDLKILVEYSNETWNWIFEQTHYVQDQGEGLGLSANRWEAGQMFVAMRSAEIWKIFEDELGAEAGDRLIKVMASQTGDGYLSRQRLDFLNDPALNPDGVRADAISIAPYFGGEVATDLVNEGIVNTVTPAEIIDRALIDMRGNTTNSIITHQQIAQEYDAWLILYEGGQHIVGSFADQGNQALTDKLIAANRHPLMFDVYTEYLDMLNDNGVVMFSNFSYVTEPSQYGSWGILEDQDQAVSEAHKYRAIVDWISLHPPLNAPPVARPGIDFAVVDLDDNKYEYVSLDGSDSRDFDGQLVSYEWMFNGNIISNSATATVGLPLGVHDVDLTVTDDSGLAVTSSVQVTIAPATATQVLVESNFTGTSPSNNTPWTATSTQDANVTISGWTLGSGLSPAAHDDKFACSGLFPGDPQTLTAAIADNEYFTITVQPQNGFQMDLRGASFAFTVERIFYHAPRTYHVMSSVDGFTESTELYNTGHFDNQTPMDFEFTLPFDGFLTDAPIEFRIYMSEGQWGGHEFSLNQFKLNGATTDVAPLVCPESLVVTRGNHIAGTVFDLYESDNVDVSIRRGNTDIQARARCEVKAISPIANPSALSFTVEASVFARSTVNQNVSLMNYQTGQFELVDTGIASRFNDAITILTPAGDLSRFIEPSTGCMTAEIEFHSVSQRQRFTANIDRTVWEIE